MRDHWLSQEEIDNIIYSASVILDFDNRVKRLEWMMTKIDSNVANARMNDFKEQQIKILDEIQERNLKIEQEELERTARENRPNERLNEVD